MDVDRTSVHVYWRHLTCQAAFFIYGNGARHDTWGNVAGGGTWGTCFLAAHLLEKVLDERRKGSET